MLLYSAPEKLGRDELLFLLLSLLNSAWGAIELPDRHGEPVVIRRVLPGNLSRQHLDVFLRGFRSAYQHLHAGDADAHFTGAHDLNRQLTRNYWEEVVRARAEQSVLVEARRENNVVGFLSYSWMGGDVPSVWINQLSVDPSQRGRGVGRLLIRALGEDPELAPTVDNLYLTARRTNIAALDFYFKLGFKEIEPFGEVVQAELFHFLRLENCRKKLQRLR